MVMGVGPPGSPIRRRLQTTASCAGTTAGVVSVAEKAPVEGVRCEPVKTDESEPPMTRREAPKDVETEDATGLGTSLGATWLLPKRHPAYRRREPGSGANVERVKLRLGAAMRSGHGRSWSVRS